MNFQKALNKEYLFLTLSLLLIFFIIYSPHFNYGYPLHIDEWHHISEARHIVEGTWTPGSFGYRIGFHILLAGITIILSLFKLNLVLIYKFFPAICGVVSASILYFLIKKQTNSWLTAIFSIFCFASLKSNVNILGLWFFTPLIATIPLIYLYTYLLGKGLDNLKQDSSKGKSQITQSFLIMIISFIIYPLSVLFFIPTLILVLLINWKVVLKNFNSFLLLINLPLIGISIYVFMNHKISNLFTELVFKKGWGVVEYNNSLFELFSLLGYILVLIGVYFLVKTLRKNSNLKLIYLFWLITSSAGLVFYHLFDFLVLVPFQRLFYYFGLVLPIFASFGFYYILTKVILIFKKVKTKPLIKKITLILLTIAFILFLFFGYLSLPTNSRLYHIIYHDEYSACSFLETLPQGLVLSDPVTSSAIYPISGKQTISKLVFNINLINQNWEFFNNYNCSKKNAFILDNHISYIHTYSPINCSWNLIYQNKNNYIYQP